MEGECILIIEFIGCNSSKEGSLFVLEWAIEC